MKTASRYGCPEVLGRVRVLPHPDSTLRTRHGAALWVAEERAQVRVERGTYGVGPENEGSACAAPTLRKAVYGRDIPIYVTVDTSPTGIGWVIT